MNACHVIPSQYISKSKPPYNNNSLNVKSTGNVLEKKVEAPNNAFVQLRKKKVGPNKYNKTIKIKHKRGNKSKKKPKNNTSVINIIEPGKPKKTNKFTKLTRKSFGHKKLIPLISVINRVLKRRPIASTSKKEFVDNSA
jgi:hypothetical protein